MDVEPPRGTEQAMVSRARALSESARAASAASRAASAASRILIDRASDQRSRTLRVLERSRALFDAVRPERSNWQNLDFLDRRQAWIEQKEIDREVRATDAARARAGRGGPDRKRSPQSGKAASGAGEHGGQ